jgi:DedD protein
MLDQGFEKREDDKGHARRKIVVRLAVAAGLIAALLATLLIFEQQKQADQAPSVPLVSKPDIGVAFGSSTNALSEDVQRAIKDAPDTAQTALASMSAPAEPVIVESAPPAPIVPEESKDPSVKPVLGVPVASPRRLDPHTGKAAHNDRLLVEAPKPATPPPSPPPSVSSVPMPVAAPAVPVAAGSFVVQLGVFNNVSNAEELRTKLRSAGIPSQLETRVQVGPFANKEDAIKAQEKLRMLGLGSGMLVLPKKP